MSCPHGYEDAEYCDKCEAVKSLAWAQERIAELEEEVNKLQKQLPESMQECTIVVKHCPVGHAWLTATNWIQHECPTCERNKLRAEIDRLEEARDNDTISTNEFIDRMIE